MINFGPIEANILIGNAPQSSVDIARLKQLRVTAVISLQSDSDFRAYRINWDKLQKSYQQNDILVQRFPITDFDEMDLGNKVAQPAKALSELLIAGHSVYIHCNAGVCRAPATVLTYLCHYRGMTIEKGLEYIRVGRPQANPYLTAVVKGVAEIERQTKHAEAE